MNLYRNDRATDTDRGKTMAKAEVDNFGPSGLGVQPEEALQCTLGLPYQVKQ